MISSKSMRGLFSNWGATLSCTWPVAEGYVSYGGEIHLDPEAGKWKTTQYNPLTDSDLFLSFARLGARGHDLSEDTILRWVRKRGLLELKNPDADWMSLDNQKPIGLNEFRQEASRANEALTLFDAIRSEDYAALRSRVSYGSSDPQSKAGDNELLDVYVDGRLILMMTRANIAGSDEALRAEAINGLEVFVASRLRGVDLSFDTFVEPPGPQEVYRAKLIVSIPDLQRAIWYQFACLMSDTRPAKSCQVCEGPMFGARQDKKTCSDACRKEKSRRKKAHED